MDNWAIRIEEIGKQYRIGGPQERYRTFRDTLTQATLAPFRRAKALLSGQASGASDLRQTFWALRHISVEIPHGEVVGLIGRNGAGKSTLLKILSRITDPTEGDIFLRGRVGSLLEVGTGFHPELTGRDNVYLSGAILGMPRNEIRQKFDEIVAFAEIEKFVDTPVKHYSSGMYLRLAFAVAAHLTTEILLVDEVLAVGDVAFQKKCLGKMDDVARGGRTVIFVSHNLQAIESLCQRGLLLRNGSLVFDGSAQAACKEYLQETQATNAEDLRAYPLRQGDRRARFTRMEILDAQSGLPTRQIPSGQDFIVRLYYETQTAIHYPRFGFALFSQNRTRLFNTLPADQGIEVEVIEGEGRADIRFNNLLLAPGSYFCNLAISDRTGKYCDYVTEIPCFDVEQSALLPKTRLFDQGSGVIYVPGEWSFQ